LSRIVLEPKVNVSSKYNAQAVATYGQKT